MYDLIESPILYICGYFMMHKPGDAIRLPTGSLFLSAVHEFMAIKEK